MRVGAARPRLRAVGIVAATAHALDDGFAAPVHGRFEPDHVLLGPDGLGLVDLGAGALADPLLDAAALLARLRGLPLEHPMDPTVAEAAVDDFADAYLARPGRPRPAAGRRLRRRPGRARRGPVPAPGAGLARADRPPRRRGDGVRPMIRVCIVEDHERVRAGIEALVNTMADAGVVASACDGGEGVRRSSVIAWTSS